MATDLRNEARGVTAAHVLSARQTPPHVNIDQIEWDEVKAETQYRFVKAMHALGREVTDENVAALMDEEQALLQQCWNWARANFYDKREVRQRRITDDSIELLIAEESEALPRDLWQEMVFAEIDEDWSGQYQEIRDSGSPAVLKAIDIAKQALGYVDEGLPIPSRLRKAAHTLRKSNPELVMDLRLLAA